MGRQGEVRVAEMKSDQETLTREKSVSTAGFPLADIADVLRSEPALAWFLAQGMWLSQPVLELFWPQEQITQVAELLESVRRPAAVPEPAGGEREGTAGS
jgi:hypothetical protein